MTSSVLLWQGNEVSVDIVMLHKPFVHRTFVPPTCPSKSEVNEINWQRVHKSRGYRVSFFELGPNFPHEMFMHDDAIHESIGFCWLRVNSLCIQTPSFKFGILTKFLRP